MTSPLIDALLTEREGYARRGLDERVAQVDAQLDQAGYRRDKPARRERATKPAVEKRA